MRISKATVEDLQKALESVNKKYNGNVIFNRLEAKRFTLKVKSSREAGAKLGYQVNKRGDRRKTTSACWHVHGDFFEALFEVNPQAVVYAGQKRITAEGGNWQDWNIGSIMSPLYFSEACECA